MPHTREKLPHHDHRLPIGTKPPPRLSSIRTGPLIDGSRSAAARFKVKTVPHITIMSDVGPANKLQANHQ